MSFLVSPGVHVREIDLTNVVPAVATSIGAIAGPFEKGPVKSIVNIGSIVGQTGFKQLSGYASSKSALIGLTKSFAIEMAEKKNKSKCS